MNAIGTWTRINGTIEGLGDTLNDHKELLKSEVQEHLKVEGIDPELYVYEFIIRQMYNNAAKDSFNEKPVFEENIPFVQIAIKAMPNV